MRTSVRRHRPFLRRGCLRGLSCFFHSITSSLTYFFLRLSVLEVPAGSAVAFAAALQGWWGVRLSAAALVAGALCFVPHTPLRIAGILASLGLGCAARRGGRGFR